MMSSGSENLYNMHTPVHNSFTHTHPPPTSVGTGQSFPSDQQRPPLPQYQQQQQQQWIGDSTRPAYSAHQGPPMNNQRPPPPYQYQPPHGPPGGPPPRPTRPSFGPPPHHHQNSPQTVVPFGPPSSLQGPPFIRHQLPPTSAPPPLQDQTSHSQHLAPGQPLMNQFSDPTNNNSAFFSQQHNPSGPPPPMSMPPPVGPSFPSHQFNRPPPVHVPGHPSSFSGPMTMRPQGHPTHGQSQMLYQEKSSSFLQTEQSSQGTKQEKGKKILDEWLQKSRQGKNFQKMPQKISLDSKESDVKVWEATDQLAQMSQALAEMSAHVEEVDKVLTTASTDTWDTAVGKFAALKQHYLKVQSELADVKQVEIKVLKARKNRARMKRARQDKWKASQERKEQWELKSKMIDAWQEKRNSEIREENKKIARKAAADKTLSKVNKEIHDANKLIETMTALQKLRLVRRDAAEKRGDSNLGESRETFEQKIADMIRLVKGQLGYYEEEEARLKSIIKSEVEESNLKERQSQEEKARVKQEEEDDHLKTVLFGRAGDSINEADPLFPFTQFYRQAEYDLQAFVNIRRQWDSFVVPENSPAASCIPNSWVMPEEPSSATWASVLK